MNPASAVKCLRRMSKPALHTAGDKMNIGIIVLAAGASTRMGEPKQLLRYEGETLLRRAVKTALHSACRPVVVVLGASAEVLRADLAHEIALPQTHIVVNQHWAEGMSSSIRCGIRALEALTTAQAEAVVLTLCDQPFVTGAVIHRLLKAYRAGASPLVASAYEAQGKKTRGVPALFSRALFSELQNLRGGAGAKSVIERQLSRATIVAVPEAAFDVDTPHDYQGLLA